jgi:hypothetical protein
MQDRKTDYNAGETGSGRANRKSYAGQAESSRVGRQMQDRKVGKPAERFCTGMQRIADK